jgi:hypothetical protein
MMNESANEVFDVPDPTKVYALDIRMVEAPWVGCVHVYSDGQASIHRHRARPDKPVTVHVEGYEPNEAQIKTLQTIWRVLHNYFHFNVAGFCNALLPYSRQILEGESDATCSRNEVDYHTSVQDDPVRGEQ